ncbi:MAG: acyl-ACP desaturase, partial [Candidatus Hydrogenedentes bacterium]|nr:acyl-ACP desaturase [Candidatus Hydrogenedentota bacterium]
HIVKTWEIGKLRGLRETAEAEQQYLCKRPERYRRIAERLSGRISSADHRFSWLEMPEANPDSVMNPAV